MRLPLVICLLSSVTLNHAHGYDSDRTLFSYTKNQGLLGQVRVLDDIFVLKDSTLFQGQLLSPLQLVYSFGTLSLPVDEIAFIGHVPNRPDYLQVKMINEEIFVGKASRSEITFIEAGSDKEITLPLRGVQFIALKPRKEFSTRMHTSHITLLNGDTFPFCYADATLSISNGTSKREIPTDKILSLSFNGGLIGTLIGKEGKVEDLPLSFTNSPNLNVIAGSEKHALRLPWNQISQIQKDFAYERDLAFLCNGISEEPIEEEASEESQVEAEATLNPSFDDLSTEYAVTDFNLDDLEKEVKQDQEKKKEKEEIEFISSSYSEEPLLFAMEDINLDDLEKQVESKKTEQDKDSYEFISARDEESLLAMEDFDLEDLEKQGESKKPEQDKDSYEFISEKEEESFIAMEDFNLDDLEEKKPKQDEQEKNDSYEFISYGSAHKRAIAPQDSSDPGEIAMADSDERPRPLKKLQGANEPQAVFGYVYVSSESEYNPGSYISDHLVTNLEYQQFLQEVNYKAPHHWISGKIPNGLENQPVINISYKDAYLYSVWLGKRLPTQIELENAFEKGYIERDRFAEWTATPTVKENMPLQSSRVSSSITSAHQVYGKDGVQSLCNNDCNHYTGFRVAADAY